MRNGLGTLRRSGAVPHLQAPTGVLQRRNADLERRFRERGRIFYLSVLTLTALLKRTAGRSPPSARRWADLMAEAMADCQVQIPRLAPPARDDRQLPAPLASARGKPVSPR